MVRGRGGWDNRDGERGGRRLERGMRVEVEKRNHMIPVFPSSMYIVRWCGSS
jgi:hypothetical protein